MTKALRIIAITMPIVLLALFFIPFSSMTRVYEDVVYTDQISLFSIAQDRIFNTLASIVISVFVISTLISIVCAFLTQKHSVAVCGNILSFSSIWIFASVLIAYYRQHNYQYSPHAAFYISLILSAFFLAVFIAYAVKWLKARLASIPPREHPKKKRAVSQHTSDEHHHADDVDCYHILPIKSPPPAE